MTASSLLPLYRTRDPEGEGSQPGKRCFRAGSYHNEKMEDFEKLDHQVVKLFDDADQHRRFVLPNGPPEDELVSICIIIVDL